MSSHKLTNFMFERFKNHIFTLHEKIELLALYGVVMFLLGMGLNHLLSDSKDDEQVILESASAPPIPAIVDDEEEQLEEIAQEDTKSEPEATKTETVVEKPKEIEHVRELEVERGDSFFSILTKAGVSRKETFLASKSLKKIFDPRSLKIGQKFQISFEEELEKGALDFKNLIIDEKEYQIRIEKNDKGKFVAKKVDKKLYPQIFSARGTIDSSLAKLASSLEIPPNIMAEAISYYSYVVDFQRDIQKDNRFEVLYEVLFDGDGKKVRDGDMLYALLTVDDKDLKIYHFKESDGSSDYFTEEGRSIRRSIMKTPINGAIISSPFGKRKHPILGYNKMHKGVDFAAPSGTPVYAAGDGKVTFIGVNGGYGNFIRIRHNGEYSTAYAHLRNFAKGMRKDRKVKQGQVIAYVGTSGASTGPHLHYEIIKNNKQVNPMKANVPKGKKLKGKELERFIAKKNEIDSMFTEVPLNATIKRKN